MKISDYPKIKAPFVRKKINGRYVVTPEIEPGCEWVFDDPGVIAVDKLHGTNICLYMEDGVLMRVTNRRNVILDDYVLRCDMTKQEARILSGVLHTLEKGWLKKLDKLQGNIFGELIAPNINGNIHLVDRPLFVPFDYLKSKCMWKSWQMGEYEKTYDSISEWFKTLPSLFTTRTNKNNLGEGIVFTHQDGRKAKLRRDMFDWYEGEEHG